MEQENNEYNEELVHYCPKCLSLGIKHDDLGIDYCTECGSVEQEETDIFTWIKMYEVRYGEPYIDMSQRGKKDLTQIDLWKRKNKN